ncbi:MAG: hypothetical protein GKR89_27830 [Candidatus Latescibacteria bacterium]|nr:hypothetical protein [Candidatus Latescibacterota bacterium]
MKITLFAAVIALGLSACSDRDPVSSNQQVDSTEAAAKRRASGLTVSGTAAGGRAESAARPFKVLIENISAPLPYSASGAFAVPVGNDGPGPLLPGASYQFSFTAAAGAQLSFATMYVQSNDIFLGPDATGLGLFDANGDPISGDITDQVQLWDAGTEVNQEPGVGADQAPRQSGANTGADEGGAVRLVDDGFDYGNVADLFTVTVSAEAIEGGAHFTVDIANSASSTTPLAPGVFVVHNDGEPLFSADQADRGMGLEGLAEDGNAGPLAEALAAHTGVTTILAPGVFVVHNDGEPLFSAGQADRGIGLEALAEDGNPGPLAESQDGPHGVFAVPVGSDGPGPLPPGGAYEFELMAKPGYYLSFATMFVQSNDLFFAPQAGGIALFQANGRPAHGDITDQILLWDAGTEVNQAPGIGPDQAPRQSGPDTGADEGGAVRLVDDGFSYPAVGHVLRVTVMPK